MLSKEELRLRWYIRSNFIVVFDFGEISQLDLVWPLEVPLPHSAVEIVVSIQSARPQTHLGLVQQHSNEIPKAQLRHLPNEPHFSSSSILELAPLAHNDEAGHAVEVFRVAYFCFPREGILDLWVFEQELVFPLSEVVGQGLVSLFRHDVFLYLGIVLYFFQDGRGVEVLDADDHPVLDSVEVKGTEFFVHGSDYFSLLCLEGQSYVGRF